MSYFIKRLQNIIFRNDTALRSKQKIHARYAKLFPVALQLADADFARPEGMRQPMPEVSEGQIHRCVALIIALCYCYSLSKRIMVRPWKRRKIKIKTGPQKKMATFNPAYSTYIL